VALERHRHDHERQHVLLGHLRRLLASSRRVGTPRRGLLASPRRVGTPSRQGRARSRGARPWWRQASDPSRRAPGPAREGLPMRKGTGLRMRRASAPSKDVSGGVFIPYKPRRLAMW
jgi:hypothetical protein